MVHHRKNAHRQLTVTRALAQFTLTMIRVSTRPPAHLSRSAFRQLSQVGQKCSGGSVHQSLMDLVK